MSTATPLERLFAELWDLVLDAGGLDGPELGDLLERTGLVTWREATEDDVGDSIDFAVGDVIPKLTPEGQRIVLAVRQSGDDDHG